MNYWSPILMPSLFFIMIVVVALLGTGVLWLISNLRPYKPEEHGLNKRKKHKRPPLPPLELDIQPHWVKCKIEYERSTKREHPIQSMYFSFYDENETRIHSESYRNQEAEAYSSQLSKLLEQEGLEYSDNSSYREWATYIYKRRSKR